MVIDVLVIGGGLAGCATAYYLARDGVAVTLVEQGQLNTRASGSNSGSLHAQIPHQPFVAKGEAWARAYAPAFRLLRRSIEVWSGLSDELGVDLEVGLKGGLLVASSDGEMRDIERKATVERSVGVPIDLLDRGALRRLAPYVASGMVGGAFCPLEGQANPLVVAPAFAAAAERLGGTIRRRTQVLGIKRSNEGFEVRTSAGLLHARRIVDAAGADAGTVAALVGIALPVQGSPIQTNVTEPIAPLIPHLVYFAGAKLTLKQTRLGTLLIGGGWSARLDTTSGRPVADPDSLAANLGVALTVVPSLASVAVVRTWAAIVNDTEDWMPILGEIPGVPGFFVNVFPSMGFTAGPIAARIVASLVQGRAPPVDFDLAPFRPGAAA